MPKRVAPLLFPLLLTACSPSDEELCEDVQKKLRDCGTIGPSSCPETLRDEIREQYECIMNTKYITSGVSAARESSHTPFVGGVFSSRFRFQSASMIAQMSAAPAARAPAAGPSA